MKLGWVMIVKTPLQFVPAQPYSKLGSVRFQQDRLIEAASLCRKALELQVGLPARLWIYVAVFMYSRRYYLLWLELFFQYVFLGWYGSLSLYHLLYFLVACPVVPVLWVELCCKATSDGCSVTTVGIDYTHKNASYVVGREEDTVAMLCLYVVLECKCPQWSNQSTNTLIIHQSAGKTTSKSIHGGIFCCLPT